MTRIFDLHDTAYYVWRDAGIRAATLVHVDAHHDIERAREDGAIDIGNFIRAAIRDGIVAAVSWVVPEPMWHDPRTRRWLWRELAYARADTPRIAGDTLLTAFDGVPVWVGTLDALPAAAGPVLLDVDIDFMLSAARHPKVSQWPLPVPWCWPEELAGRLRARHLQPACVTIATSVTGGFTPLRWQHLGRDLAMRLEGGGEPARLRAFDAIAEAARAREAGRPPDREAADAACRRAIAECPEEPAAHFHHAELLQSRGEIAAARDAFDRARALDPSYRHPFRTRGAWFLRRERLREAGEAFGSALALDPDDPYAQIGLAMIALRSGDAREARRLAERGVAEVDSADGWRTLARAAARLGDRARALDAYARAMKLTLHGAVPFTGPWAANLERRLVDPWHWRDHAEVAALHVANGEIEAAIAHLRIAAAAAPRMRWLPLRLAALHARRGEWRRAARAVGQSLELPRPWPFN